MSIYKKITFLTIALLSSDNNYASDTKYQKKLHNDSNSIIESKKLIKYGYDVVTAADEKHPDAEKFRKDLQTPRFFDPVNKNIETREFIYHGKRYLLTPAAAKQKLDYFNNTYKDTTYANARLSGRLGSVSSMIQGASLVTDNLSYYVTAGSGVLALASWCLEYNLDNKANQQVYNAIEKTMNSIKIAPKKS